MKTHALINFNIPLHLKTYFDQLVDFKRVSRTSVLNTLIENYCRSEIGHLETDGRINDLLTSIQTRPQPHRVNSRIQLWEDTMIVGLGYDGSNDDGGW